MGFHPAAEDAVELEPQHEGGKRLAAMAALFGTRRRVWVKRSAIAPGLSASARS